MLRPLHYLKMLLLLLVHLQQNQQAIYKLNISRTVNMQKIGLK